MWRTTPPPQPSAPSWQALRQLFSDRKIGISRNPTKPAAGPGGAENGRCSRELERREGHLVAAEIWGDRASDRPGRRRCRWLDVGAPRQHPRAVCSGLSCAEGGRAQCGRGGATTASPSPPTPCLCLGQGRLPRPRSQRSCCRTLGRTHSLCSLLIKSEGRPTGGTEATQRFYQWQQRE